MARNGDYHVKVGFPSDVKLPRGHITFLPQSHTQARQDELGILSLPSGVNLNWSCCKMFEISVEDNEVWKFGIRIPRGKGKKDLCLIVSWPGGRIITLWLNSSDDDHKTLNTKRYINPKVKGKGKRFNPEKFMKQAMRKSTRR